MTFVVVLVPPAAFGYSKIEYFRPFPGIALQHSVLRAAIAVFHDVGAATEFRPLIAEARRDSFHVRQVLHGQAVVQGQLLASPHFFSRPSDLKGLDMKR